MKRQHIPRPGLAECVSLVVLLGFASLPPLAFFIGNTVVAIWAFVYLALSFWFPIGQIVVIGYCDWRAGKPWLWPRIVGGPGIHINRDPL